MSLDTVLTYHPDDCALRRHIHSITPQYSYEPLKSSRSIRLLKILDEITTAYHAAISSKYPWIGSPIYNALSYTWGVQDLKQLQEESPERDVNKFAVTPLNPLNTIFRQQTLLQRKVSNTLIYPSSYKNPKNSAAPTTDIARANEQTHQIKWDYQKAIFSKERNYAAIVCVTPLHTYILPTAISPPLPNRNGEFFHSCPAPGHRYVSRLLAIEEVICTNFIRLG
jgi:hypothetical protein